MPLGMQPSGVTSVELADGSRASKLTTSLLVSVHGEDQAGVVILEPNGSQALLGMTFLRIFQRAFLVSRRSVLLIDEAKLSY